MDIFALMLSDVLRAGMPMLLAVLGEITVERSGHLNLGVEGLMLMGAVTGFYICSLTQNLFLGLFSAVIAGILGGLIYAVLTVSLRTNQVVTGLALTTFGTGFANFLGKPLVGQRLNESAVGMTKSLHIPFLSDIPYIGTIFFKQNIFFYITIVIAIFLGIYLFKTKWGLNLRAIGENPASADASGVRIMLYKYVHIVFGCALCALGGAYLTLIRFGVWQDNITAGRGWIAVALVIVAGYSPYRAIPMVLIFGALEIMSFYLQGSQFISVYIINMAPYIATIIALILISTRKNRKLSSPAALGNAYFREDR